MTNLCETGQRERKRERETESVRSSLYECIIWETQPDVPNLSDARERTKPRVQNYIKRKSTVKNTTWSHTHANSASHDTDHIWEDRWWEIAGNGPSCTMASWWLECHLLDSWSVILLYSNSLQLVFCTGIHSVWRNSSPKNAHFVIAYSSSCCFKRIFSSFCGTQNEMFG